MALTETSLGAGQAFTNIYRSHHRWLLNLLSRKLGNVDNAADLAHDTFTRLLKTGDAESLREPLAYLTTVSTHLTADYFRRQALERAYLDALASQPEATSPSPETRLLVLEALTVISRALDRLTPRVREIFMLSQIDGLAYKEIAERCGVSVNVVQKAMTKAYVHLCTVVYP